MGLFGFGKKKDEGIEKQYTQLMSDALKERSTSAAKAMANLPNLNGCEAHATYIVTGTDKKALKDLKINITCESEFIEE